ncbi:MAG: S41 family peptidase [Chloroflexi bacterium]|nr:S41 family peptidase [Chloroflexota bacterium]
MVHLLRAFGQRFPHWKITLLISVVFIAGFTFGHQYSVISAQANNNLSQQTEDAFDAFWEVYHLIRSSYLNPVSDETLVDGAITGMVDALEDQYSGYMSPEVFPLMNSDMSGEIEGIGVVIRTIEESGRIEVVSVLDGSPAQEAGILPGDMFAQVDGQDVTNFSQLELAGVVRGPAGTAVTIIMERDGELIEFVVTRARIEIPNTETQTFGTIGYVQLNQFTPSARQDLINAIESLNPDELTGLIIDLRGNPGGLLSSAIDVGSMFVPAGEVLLTEDFGRRGQQVFEADAEDYYELDIPIVVLVDETSASASELVSGAWQDYGVVTLIGETTLGKGTVQTWQELSNGGGVRLTIARWLRPSGEWIHGVGVTPDIVVEWSPENYDDMRNPETDPQLSTALSYLEDPSQFDLDSVVEADAAPDAEATLVPTELP